MKNDSRKEFKYYLLTYAWNKMSIGALYINYLMLQPIASLLLPFKDYISFLSYLYGTIFCTFSN